MNKSLVNNTIKIGSRTSRLALTQTNEVSQALLACRAIKDKSHIEIVSRQSRGDLIVNHPLYNLGGKALFVSTFEEMLRSGEIDAAVHSAKDLPAKMSNDLTIAAYCQRKDSRDCFISNNGKSFLEQPIGAIIGTASPRRKAIAKSLRQDLKTNLLRGNVTSRIEKTMQGQCTGTFLAVAGLIRLGYNISDFEIMDINQFVPAGGQGALAIQTRKHDHKVINIIKQINNLACETMLKSERAFIRRIDGSCTSPIGVNATISENEVILNTIVLLPDGSKSIKLRGKAPITESEVLGNELGKQLLQLACTDIKNTISRR